MSMGWFPRPAVWEMPEDEVHVWLIGLDRPMEEVTALAARLAADEVKRAGRFYRARARNHFVVARGLLRTILGGYLDVAPEDLRFVLNKHGKPALADKGEQGLSFNISHSGEIALLALTRKLTLGVDIERVRTNLDYQRLARRFFSAAEFAALDRLPDEAKIDAFFRCWTLKEAYIKGQGVGIALGLDSFDVSLAADEPARLLATRPHGSEAVQWQLRGLQAPPGYAAALAVRGWDWTLKCYRWTDEPAAE